MELTLELVTDYHEEPKRFLQWLEATGNRPDDLSELQSLAEVEQDTFMGEYPNPADYARETATNTYELDELPNWILAHIDWEAIWDNELHYDYNYLETSDSTLIWAIY